MKKTSLKTLSSILIIAGLSGFTVQAQLLTVKSVGSVRHGADTQVTVVFSKPVDAATGGNPANYTFPGGVVTTAASLMTGLPAADAAGIAENPAPAGRVYDNECVVLTVTGLARDATTTITIQNVQDRSTPPNTIATTSITFKDSGYDWGESGTPAIAGKVIAVGTNGFDIFSAGSTQWSNYDEVTQVYKQMTGDFDVVARIEFQDFSSHWARAGIMARESLNAGENQATQRGSWTADGTTPSTTPPVPGTASRYVDVHANPVMDFNENDAPATPIHAANNGWESHIRNGKFLQNRVNGTDSQNATGGAPPYPNAWIRIQRVGDDFHTFHGSDGINWDPSADRLADVFVDVATVDPDAGNIGDPLPMKPTLLVGPSFGPETGNIAGQPSGENRLFLYQVRFVAITVPIVTRVDPSPCGVLIQIDDAPSPGTGVDPTTVQLVFDGNPVTSTATKTGTRTIVAYKAATPYAASSTHSFSLTFKDNGTPPNSQKIDRTITIPAYQTLPAAYALASPASDPGITVRMHQLPVVRGPGDRNSIPNAETELGNGYIDPGTGLPYDSGVATDPVDVNLINYTDTPSEAGNFNATLTPTTPDEAFPSGAIGDDFAMAATMYLQLEKGCYRFGVNSDDGFRVTAAPAAPDVFGTVLGSFGTGRGQSDTLFDFVVDQAGYYPVRLSYWEGGGDANLEFFSVNLDSGQKILVNDTATPGHVKAFRTGRGRAYVKSIVPFPGREVDAQPTITAILVDDLTTIDKNSIKLIIDGTDVTSSATIVKVGGTNTLNWTAPAKYAFLSAHTGSLTYQESGQAAPRTIDLSFTIRQQTPDDLPSYTAGSFWIEAEDFDSTGAPVPDVLSVMPYDIGASLPYQDIGATLNVDYFNNDNLDNTNPTTYRSTGDPSTAGRSVDVANDPNANFGERRPGGFDMTGNFKIGWGDSADWYNYTRKVPKGLYTALAALSNGGAAAGTPDRMGGTLSIVTSGVGTTTQTLKNVGTFNGPSSGAWSYNNMVQLFAPDGSQAAFKITNDTTTIRFNLREGDFDWFVLSPVTGVPPKVTIASPLANAATPAASAVPRDVKVRLTIEDFSTAVNGTLTKLFFDGNDVTSTASIAKNADVTTVTYDPGVLAGGSTHNYELRYTDNGSPALSQTNKASFVVSSALGTPGQFLIEAEDFNSTGLDTQARATASSMPYLGGAYANLGATLGVDYNDNDARDSQPYRGSLGNGSAGQNVNHDQQTDAGTPDVVRSDSWTMTANYKIGWAGEGNWYNYTRTFPANTYQVWAALSHDPADGLRGRLEQVTSDPTQPNQTVVALGTFDAPTSGAWGTDNLVQMKDSGGNPAVVSLSGVQTVRFNANSGDYDYLLFVPGTAPLRFTSITYAAGPPATVTLTWIGGGTLQVADDVNGPWINITGASPVISPIDRVKRFARICTGCP